MQVIVSPDWEMVSVRWILTQQATLDTISEMVTTCPLLVGVRAEKSRSEVEVNPLEFCIGYIVQMPFIYSGTRTGCAEQV